MEELIRDCFNGYMFTEGRPSIHPYILAIFESIVNSGKRQKGYLKTGFNLPRINAELRKALRKGYRREVRHDTDDSIHEVLTRCGYYKGPYEDSISFNTNPPNR